MKPICFPVLQTGSMGVRRFPTGRGPGRSCSRSALLELERAPRDGRGSPQAGERAGERKGEGGINGCVALAEGNAFP